MLRASPFPSLLVCVHREHVQHSEESSPSLAASLRHQSMKQSPSQHSFDSAILDGSLPDETLSVDSDVSDGFFVLMDSGTSEHTLDYFLELKRDICFQHVPYFQSQVWSLCDPAPPLLAVEAVQPLAQRGAHQLISAVLCPKASRMYLRIWSVMLFLWVHEKIELLKDVFSKNKS